MAQRKATLGSHWMSVTDVLGRLQQARDNRQAQQRLLTSLNQQVEQRRVELERSLADLPEHERTNIINRTVAGTRAEMRKASNDTRTAHVRQAGKIHSEVAGAKALYGSSVQMLIRHNLGSERRSRILEQIADSGPAELAGLAELAAATRDVELAAALCSKVSRLMPSERPFAAQELADVLVGDEHRKVAAAILEIERLTEEAAHDDTAFGRNGRDPVRSVKIARMKQAEAAVDGDLSELDEEAA
jgi:hypothetical protein